MQRKIYPLVSALLLLITFFGIEKDGLAFSVEETSAEVGAPVFLHNVVFSHYYAVFPPQNSPTSHDQCAFINGADLILDNNLRNYGTCFINDLGDFVVVELSEPFAANYTDSVNSLAFIGMQTLTILADLPVTD